MNILCAVDSIVLFKSKSQRVSGSGRTANSLLHVK